jgi:hypothetical protein
MEKITHTELAIKMANVKSTFIGIKALTKQNKLNKGRGANAMSTKLGIDPENIKKEFQGTVYCGCDYETLVNNRLKKENAGSQVTVTFEAGEMSGVEWIKGAEGKVLRNGKGELQLRTYPDLSNNVPKVSYLLEGAPINIKEARFDEYRKPDRDEGTNQGLEKAIKPRNYGFDSLREITLDGVTYEVIPD